MSDVQDRQEGGRHVPVLGRLCGWLTSRPAVLLFAICLAYADKRIYLRELHEWYFALAVAIAAIFWYVTLRVAVKSFLFSILVLLPLLVDMAAELNAVLGYHAEYRTVIQTAFHTTVVQASPYVDGWVVAGVLAAVLAAVAAPVAGRLAGRGGALKSLAIWGLVTAALAYGVKGPGKYLLSTYKQHDWNWNTWMGERMNEPGLHRNPLFRGFVDEEHPEDVMLPCTRITVWYDEAVKCYFPPSFKDCADEESECRLPEGCKVNVVLYVVESFRRDHSPFSGYARNTLPCLSGKHGGNLIVLPGLRSFGTHSVQSLYGMLSDADERNRDGRYNCFQALFRKHGFNCLVLENNAFGASWSDRPLFRQLFKGCGDTSLILHDDNNFAPITSKHIAGNDRNMFIIYDGSSHYPFDTPGGSRYGDSLIDNYDETRHIIDAAASAFLDSLADTPSIVLITSDHGESFGEGGRLCHGGPLSADEQREVFAAIWYSDAYAAQFPEIVQSLKENAAAFTSQDFFFHTIPSMGGIHSSQLKPEWDMTQPQPLPSRN